MPATDLYGFPLLAGEDERAVAHASAAAKRTANVVWQGVDTQLTQAGAAAPVPASRVLVLKPLVRKGIPHELRPTQWFIISGAAARQAQAALEGQTYADLCDINNLPKTTLLTVSEDLSAGVFQFRSHALFRKQAGMDAVRRLVGAFLARNPGGHFRGISHVAGFLLIVMGLQSEEQAFWTLVALLEDKAFPATCGRGGLGSRVELRLLELLVAQKLPRVAGHLAKLETSVAAVAGTWFSGLFTTALPAEVTARVFDCLLLEGAKVLQRVGLALLKTYERSICAASHPAQLRQVLDSRAARMYDGDALMAAAFRGIGALPGARVSGLRGVATTAVEAAMAEQRQRLEMIICRTH